MKFEQKLGVIALLSSIFAITGCADDITQELCGNGIIDAGENCDGLDLNGQTCSTVNSALMGTGLKCNATCQFDTSGCQQYVAPDSCGNGTVETGEECDGLNLNGATCNSVRPGTVGMLKCNNCRFDASLCTAGSPGGTSICGNLYAEDGEECDGNDFKGKTCATEKPGTTGNLVCNECKIDASSCIAGATPTCGNNIIEAGEACDGTDLDGETCATIDDKLTGNGLKCTKCAFDTSDCQPIAVKPECGNNVIETGEACDGSNLDEKTCSDISSTLTGNGLKCTKCAFDTSGCDKVTVNTCGNGQIDNGELCDGSNLNNKTCKDINPSFTSGTLSCTDKCAFNTSSCKAEPTSAVCGNKTVEDGEDCEGSDYVKCSKIDGAYTEGYAACSNCKYDLTNCKYPVSNEKEIKWCKIVEPLIVTFDDNTTSATLKGQVIIPTVTDKTNNYDADSSVKAQVVFGTDFKTIDKWKTITATGDTSFTNAAIDQYTAEIKKSSFVDTKTAYFLWRFSDDSGNTWRYCKRDTDEHTVTEYDFHDIDPIENQGFLPNPYNSGAIHVIENSSGIITRWDFNSVKDADKMNPAPSQGTGALTFTGVKGYVSISSDGKGGSSWNISQFRKRRENDPTKPNDTDGAIDPSGPRIRLSNITSNTPITLSVDIWRNHAKNSPYYVTLGYATDCKNYTYLPESEDISLDLDPEHAKKFYTYTKKLPNAVKGSNICIEIIAWGRDDSAQQVGALRFDNLTLSN